MPRVDPETGEIRVCRATKVNGEPCSSAPVGDTDLCVYHSPLYAGDLEAGRQLGGRRPTLKRLPEMPGELNTPEDVLKAVNALVAALGERDLTPPNVTALIRLYGLALGTMTGVMQEERLAALEDELRKEPDA